MFFFPSIFISWTPPGPRSSSRAAHRGGLELQIDVSDEAEGIGHLMVVPYGESADCYSMANCSQGKFSINLSETSIQYGCRGSRLLLYLLGRNMNILTFQENQIVYGRVGERGRSLQRAQAGCLALLNGGATVPIYANRSIDKYIYTINTEKCKNLREFLSLWNSFYIFTVYSFLFPI